MAPQIAQKFQSIISQLQALQAAEQYTAACVLFAEQIEWLLEQSEWQSVASVILAFPAPVAETNLDLRYVQGLTYAKAGRFAEAIRWLESVRVAHFSQQAYAPGVRCCLELARLYHIQEEFRIAYNYLVEDVQPLIENSTVRDSQLLGRFYLRRAEICPDVGQLALSNEFAQKALFYCRQAGDLIGEFQVLMRLASTAIEGGDFAEAQSRYERVRICQETGQLGVRSEARWLNFAVHFHWYQGELAAAIPYAQRLLQVADAHNLGSQRVYARILLGSLHRELGEFVLAEQWYRATRRTTDEIDYPLFHPWIDVQMSWLRFRQNRLAEARALVHASMKSVDRGQKMSFQVFLAVINLVDGQLALAARPLQESLAYYEQAGEPLAICSLHFHLAYLAWQQADLPQTRHHLHNALGWLAQKQIAYSHYWWHPAVISAMCCHALTLDIYSDVAERILINHLGEAGIAALRQLLQAGIPQLRTRAAALLRTLDQPLYTELTPLDESRSKRVLATLLQQGQLRADGFERLQAELTTASQRNTPNPTLLAVFGLYVNGVARSEIAKQLDCSITTVRNYITIIYQHFGGAADSFATRQERRQWLITLARRRGFI